MRTVIIALPVDDDVDILDVADVVNEAFGWDGEDDSREACVYESAEALAEDLGWDIEP